MSDIIQSFSEIKICRWCKTEGLIPFEYIKTTKKKRQYKGKCPGCGKTNMRYLREGAAPPGAEESAGDPAPNFPPEESAAPPGAEESAAPPGAEEGAAPPGGPAEIIKPAEVPPEEEEEEEEKDKKPFPIGLTICVAIIIILVILNVWVFTQYNEKKKEVEAYGNTKDQLDRDR